MPEIHLIGNSHIDPVWLWRWQEGFAEILATCRSVLDRMNEFPEIKFTSACAVYYEWIEKADPDMFKEIQYMVSCGRWNIVGGWFLQPDCNIPDGESYIRHALISQKYFKEKFGKTAITGYNVDSFGHNASLPKILKSCGIENYVFMRPSPEEQGSNESLFTWESDDGSKVTAYRIPEFYNIELSRLDTLDRIKEKADTENTDQMAFYGIGNHGGGPSIKLIDAINKLDISNMKYSTPDEYFSAIDKTNLPILKGELQHHARGCYSANAEIKKTHRLCEQNILMAERFCLIAKELTGCKYPTKKLNKCWKNLMFNQFHDIITGCSIQSAYQDANYLFGEIMSITEQEINFAMQKIAWNINTLQGETLPAYRNEIQGDMWRKRWTVWEHEVLGTPIVVFNPHCHKVTQNINIYAFATCVTDENGNEIPFQQIRGEQTNCDDKYNTLFTAEVSPLGYRVYRVFTEKKAEKIFKNKLYATETSLENSKIRVILDRHTGDICEFYDKQNNRHIINKVCNAVLLDETECDTWAHGKDKLGNIIGEFTEPEFQIIENGPVRAAILVTTKFNNSILQRTYSITDSDTLNVHTKVDFHEKHRTLKFTFPLTDETVIAKIPFGTICRKGYTGEEPFGSWFASGNLCVANDSKYGYDTENGYMRMTVLRGAVFADHYGERDYQCEYIDQGVHEFNYMLFPYQNNSKCERKTEELNFGLKNIIGSFHSGSLPEKISCFKCDNEEILISSIKKAEENEKSIIRVYNMANKDLEAHISLFSKNIDVKVPNNSIITLNETGEITNSLEEK